MEGEQKKDGGKVSGDRKEQCLTYPPIDVHGIGTSMELWSKAGR
jgi:hypothetical protein